MYGSSRYRSYGRVIPVGPFSRGRTVYPQYPNRKRKRGAPVRQGRMVRRRIVKSFTATRTRRKRRALGAKKTGDNSSHSKCVMGSKMRGVPNRVYKSIMGMNTRLVQGAGRFQSTAGVQAVRYWTTLQRDQLAAIETEVKALAVANGANANSTTKLFLGWVRSRIHVRNQSNSVCKLVLYDLAVKRQTAATAIDEPTECWNLGMTDAGPSSGASDSTLIGATPYQSPLFKRYFSVRKVTIVDLEPGQQHEHIRFHRIGRIVGSEQWDRTTGVSHSGLTSYTMAVLHGALYHESATPDTVTYMPVTCDFAVSDEIRYGYVPYNTVRIQPPESAFTKTIVNGDFMGENQDQDVDLIQA